MGLDLAMLTGYWISAVKIAAVLILAYAAVRLGDSLIARLFQSASKAKGLHVSDSRGKTLAGLLSSALRYAMGTVVLLTILDLVGIDTSALLGGAAILGVAVGFGAQNLVRDIITGFFIIYERQYDVGDYITAADVSGVVEEIGLRTTRLRDWSGEVHVIPNGLIDKTTNRSKAGSRALVRVILSHEADIRKAMAQMQEVCDQMAREHPVITDGPIVLGISNIDLAGVEIQIWARTKPLEQWAIERELRLRLKEALQASGTHFARLTVVDDGGRPVGASGDSSAGGGSAGGGPALVIPSSSGPSEPGAPPQSGDLA
ncbi:MAG: mechanosensitive ion channel family protein [Bacillota bacterium]